MSYIKGFLPVGTKVIYSGAKDPGYRQRTGEIVDVATDTERYRVLWDCNNVRTWVKVETVSVLPKTPPFPGIKGNGYIPG